MFNRRSSIPERWESYTNMGHQIPGTRLIPFKTPLRKEVLLPRMSRNNFLYFDSQTLLDHCPNLGLVVDLTFTKLPYYCLKPLERSGVEWTKLRIAGKVIPTKQKAREFSCIVEKFLAQNEDNDKLIGVHCTHGLNRTGYIVCRYMIEQLGVPADQAIADFQSARGHEIESAPYLAELRQSSWSLNQSLNSSQSQEEEPEDDARKSWVARTPPYMPHLKQNTPRMTRGLKRKSSSLSVEKQEIRYADCPLNANSSFSGSMSEQSSGTELDTPSEPLGGKKKTPTATRERDDQASSKAGLALGLGKQYYDSYFQGHPQSQYEPDFYIRGGGGIGPHRIQSRWLPPTKGNGKQPRQYKGPKPYRSPREEWRITPSLRKTPAGENEPTGKSRSTPSPSAKSPGFDSKWNPRSPGTSDGFGPEVQYGRKRSGRFQPY